jgi:hypothetical protein
MIKFTARVTALACLLAIFSFGQEFAWDAFPEQMRKPIPDAVLYRLFLEHVSAFENQARLNDAQGQSGEAWRNHLAHQFGLPADELSGIVQVALELTDQLSKLRSQQRAIATRFRTAEIRTQVCFRLNLSPLFRLNCWESKRRSRLSAYNRAIESKPVSAIRNFHNWSRSFASATRLFRMFLKI